jgi:uncharacterized protein (TIGR02145 family)
MKTQSLSKSILRLAFIALLLSITSCDAANNPSALAGRWVGVSGEDRDAMMELLSDGTGIITGKGSKGDAIKWKTENGRFYMTVFGLEGWASGYKLQGSLLTLTGDDGKINEYTKCNKDCKEAAKEHFKAKFASKVKKSSFTDSRDGKGYKTVKFDNKTWMAENLNFNAEGSKCYDNESANCQKYGRLYNWSTATEACPSGWHLSHDGEWSILVDFAGGNEVAGNILKASSGWDDYEGKSGNGVDAFGFSALPGGRGGYSDVSFGNVGTYGSWWSATEFEDELFYYWDMDCSYAYVDNRFSGMTDLLSVRCVQD